MESIVITEQGRWHSYESKEYPNTGPYHFCKVKLSFNQIALLQYCPKSYEYIIHINSDLKDMLDDKVKNWKYLGLTPDGVVSIFLFNYEYRIRKGPYRLSDCNTHIYYL